MSEPGRRQDKLPCPGKLRGETAYHDGPQRNAMNDVGTLRAQYRKQLDEIAHNHQRTETAPFAFNRNDGNAIGPEPLAILPHPGRNGDLIPTVLCGLRHGQKVRDKKPVFGDEIKNFRHVG